MGVKRVKHEIFAKGESDDVITDETFFLLSLTRAGMSAEPV